MRAACGADLALTVLNLAKTDFQPSTADQNDRLAIGRFRSLDVSEEEVCRFLLSRRRTREILFCASTAFYCQMKENLALGCLLGLFCLVSFHVDRTHIRLITNPWRSQSM